MDWMLTILAILLIVYLLRWCQCQKAKLDEDYEEIPQTKYKTVIIDSTGHSILYNTSKELDIGTNGELYCSGTIEPNSSEVYNYVFAASFYIKAWTVKMEDNQ